jgi:hypothetical protein
MALLDAWMPTYDVAARYAVHISAAQTQVYATLLATDFGRPWLVRVLMGVRLLPALLRSPGPTWRRLVRPSHLPRASLSNIAHSGFVLLEERPPQEIVVGITGRFWTLTSGVVPIPPERFREVLPAGLAQAAWSFEVTADAAGAALVTETRIRTADAASRRHFQRYWRLVAPGSGLIRRAILRQVRREAMAGAASQT